MCRPPLPPRARGVDCNICLRLQHNGRRHNKMKTRESIWTTIRRYNKTKTREVYTNDKTTQPIFQYHYRKKTPFWGKFFFLRLRTPRGGPQEGESCCLGAVGPAPGEKGDSRGEERLRNEALILYYRFYESEIDERRREARRAKIEWTYQHHTIGSMRTRSTNDEEKRGERRSNEPIGGSPQNEDKRTKIEWTSL